MSDSCGLTITFRRDELKEFNEVLKDEILNEVFWNEDHGDDTEVIAVIYEAGYGWYDELKELTKAGLTFYGDHSEGGDYGACTFAGHKGKSQTVLSNRDGCPVVTVPENLQLHEDELNDVKEYWEIYRKAVAYIEREKEDITSA